MSETLPALASACPSNSRSSSRVAGSVSSRVRILVPKRHQILVPQQFPQSAIPREDHGQERRGIEVGAGENPQLAEDVGAHLLGFVDQEHRADPRGGHVGFPPLAERFEPAPAIVRCQLHREDVAQLAVEVGALRLGPFDHADGDIPQGRQPSGDNPQRH